MKTDEFILALRAAPNNQLIFINEDWCTVPKGYHLTELKSAAYETVDCGGQVNQWKETIVQLWLPRDPADDYMTAAKFLKIFDKVHSMIPLDCDAEIRFEYGDEDFFLSTYHVRTLNHIENATRVFLEPPATTCKALDRRGALQVRKASDSCCSMVQSCC